MSDYVKIASSSTDQFLSALAETQETFLKSLTAFATWTPTAPPVPVLAFATDAPTPRELSDASFSFAEKLLKQQKAFTEKFFAVPAMSTPAVSAPAVSAPAKGSSARN